MRGRIRNKIHCHCHCQCTNRLLLCVYQYYEYEDSPLCTFVDLSESRMDICVVKIVIRLVFEDWAYNITVRIESSGIAFDACVNEFRCVRAIREWKFSFTIDSSFRAGLVFCRV